MQYRRHSWILPLTIALAVALAARRAEPHAPLLEHKCVPFADGLLYQDLIHKP